MTVSDLDGALRQWLRTADACWLTSQKTGVLAPLCPVTPDHPWTAEAEWALTGWTALQAQIHQAQVSTTHPLPQSLARLRDEEGRTVIAMLFRLHEKSAHPEIWHAPMAQALGWGCNPWTPGMDGDSALLKLQEVTDLPTMKALFEVFDQAGVAWERTFEPSQPDPLVAGPTYPWPVHPTDTLLEHAAFASGLVIDGLDPTVRPWLLHALGHRLRPDLTQEDALGRTLADVMGEDNPARPVLHQLEGELRAQDRLAHAQTLTPPPAVPRRPRPRA